MKAGRELDALVAEKVMGYKIGWFTDYGFKKEFERKVIALKGDRYDNIPRYSTNISDAWQVVEKMKEKERVVEIKTFDFGYTVEINNFYPTIKQQAETAPLAICLSALKMKGIDIG
jgi:hypothetical protein